MFRPRESSQLRRATSRRCIGPITCPGRSGIRARGPCSMGPCTWDPKTSSPNRLGMRGGGGGGPHPHATRLARRGSQSRISIEGIRLAPSSGMSIYQVEDRCRRRNCMSTLYVQRTKTLDIVYPWHRRATWWQQKPWHAFGSDYSSKQKVLAT